MNKKDYIFGLRAVIEAIEAGSNIDKVLVKKDLNGDLAKELFGKIKQFGVVLQKVPVEKLNRITMKNHQGCIAFLSPVSYYKLEDLIPIFYEEGRLPFIMLLDGLTDTRNFGAIARTAECAGVDAIVIPARGSVSVTPDAIKTSAGALFNIPVCREWSILEAVKQLKNTGYKIVGASEKSNHEYTAIDYSDVPVGIIMGAEDVGISDEVLRACDDLASIPICGNIGSLNVSVAAGVMMYEVVRQRRESKN